MTNICIIGSVNGLSLKGNCIDFSFFLFITFSDRF